TGALDLETGIVVLDALVRANRELNATVVIITHNVSIAGLADRVVRMRSGSIASLEKNRERITPAQLTW
ncbi:MAG TPA: hypothetical protein VF055_08730, partial [Steroidobacteraceae bacterium]